MSDLLILPLVITILIGLLSWCDLFFLDLPQHLCHLSLGADDVCKGSKDLLAALCQIAEIVIVGLHELPDHRHCEHNDQSNGGPNRNGVVAHQIPFCSGDLNGKGREKVILFGSRVQTGTDSPN